MNIELSTADAATIKGILMSVAEEQDARAIPSMELLARIKRDEPDETLMIEQLDEQIVDFEEDSVNIRRIADLFPGA